VDTAEFCRQIETYLCRKNDGHLIRVSGPAFEIVAGWAARGVPLKVAFEGIDRYFERYYRKGPRRRPVQIAFCEGDVLDVFDAWRRATGILPSAPVVGAESDADSIAAAPRGSLPSHLERVLTRLTAARASGALGDAADSLLDRISRELDEARAHARGVRGAARVALIERLATLDAELVGLARQALDDDARSELNRIADDELSAFRAAMSDDAYARARQLAVERLVRERFRLPVVAFG
jgi:hypothetical protein